MNIEQERAELLPCPFCGEGKDLIVQHHEGTIIRPAYRIYCGNCGASSGYSDRVDPAKYWNSRAVLQSAQVQAWLEAEDVLRRNGFVKCDIPACNCGSWHARYGLPERMQEIKDALAEAGHPLSNDNGNLAINALSQLIKESQAWKLDAKRYQHLKNNHTNSNVKSNGKFGLPDLGQVLFEWRRREWKDGKPYVAMGLDEAIDHARRIEGETKP